MTSTKHKVLIFGEKVYGEQKPYLSVDYCDVDVLSFPGEFGKFSRLADYDLVILDYSAFLTEGTPLRRYEVFQREQEIFEKQMLAALDSGTCFCILHYDEEVPPQSDLNHSNGYMNTDAMAACNDTQIGFRWLYRFKIRPYHETSPIITSVIHRDEFKTYHDHWGASKNHFAHYGENKLDDVIFSLSDTHVQGFVLSVRRGKILYLPCQRDFRTVQAVKDCLETLINSIITYLTRSRTTVPSWAIAPFFDQESKLNTELSELQSKIDTLRSALQPYQEAKTLAFLSEYEFEDAVPEFFTNHLKLPTLRNEKYKEDFWIVNAQSEKVVIAETKSHARGLKKTDIYSLYNHREANGLDETFPALLVVNVHLDANSWKEKLRPIDPQDYQVAADNNILIVRVEDLLFFWNSIIEGRYTQDELLAIFLSESGWMEVKANGDISIHKKPKRKS